MITEVIKKLEKSKEFVSWHKKYKKAYLVHAFTMFDKANKGIWQIGYFNPDSNLISVFVVDEKITKNEDAEVFKEQEKMIQKLNKEEIKINEDEALKTAEDILNTHYKTQIVFKSFMILQNIENIGQVWNVTFVTNEFKTVNVKIDSKSGKCLSHKIISLIQGEKE